jgi:hypothetical protein
MFSPTSVEINPRAKFMIQAIKNPLTHQTQGISEPLTSPFKQTKALCCTGLCVHASK